MAELTPHPLVISVALELGRPAPDTTPPPGSLEEAADNLEKASSASRVSEAKVAEAQDELAKVFADQANVPSVTLFAGYLGGAVDHAGEGTNDYRLLYLDALLADWMLIQATDIVAHERLATENAPAGVIDMLWVKSTANLVTGTGPRANAGRFLVGALTRAGDFAPSTRGGTFSAASGLLCEATTPGCCRATRTTCH